MWYTDNLQSIGQTPLIRLNRLTEGCEAKVLVKVEGEIHPIPSNVG